MKRFRRPTWLALSECRRAAARGDLQFLMMRDSEIHAHVLVESVLRALAAHGRLPRPKPTDWEAALQMGAPKKHKPARKLAVPR